MGTVRQGNPPGTQRLVVRAKAAACVDIYFQIWRPRQLLIFSGNHSDRTYDGEIQFRQKKWNTANQTFNQPKKRANVVVGRLAARACPMWGGLSGSRRRCRWGSGGGGDGARRRGSPGIGGSGHRAAGRGAGGGRGRLRRVTPQPSSGSLGQKGTGRGPGSRILKGPRRGGGGLRKSRGQRKKLWFVDGLGSGLGVRPNFGPTRTSNTNLYVQVIYI